MKLPAWLLILLLALAPLLPAAADDTLVEGRDYALIEDPVPWQQLEGKVEVVEVFSYACGHCRDFHPMVERWRRGLDDDVRFTYLPVTYSERDAFAAGFFAAEQIGALDRVHGDTFEAVYRRTLPRNATAAEVAWYYAGLGVDREALEAAMRSQSTQESLAAARDFMLRSGVEGTPTLVVNGRYRIQGRSLADHLRIADALIARERAANR